VGLFSHAACLLAWPSPEIRLRRFARRLELDRSPQPHAAVWFRLLKMNRANGFSILQSIAQLR
jgi:hypothetical protein